MPKIFTDGMLSQKYLKTLDLDILFSMVIVAIEHLAGCLVETGM